jgi:hypothetical protein
MDSSRRAMMHAYNYVPLLFAGREQSCRHPDIAAYGGPAAYASLQGAGTFSLVSLLYRDFGYSKRRALTREFFFFICGPDAYTYVPVLFGNEAQEAGGGPEREEAGGWGGGGGGAHGLDGSVFRNVFRNLHTRFKHVLATGIDK